MGFPQREGEEELSAERFQRTKSVMASGAIALVIAALAFGVTSSVLGSKPLSQHLGFDLTSGASSFTITSSIYPSPACSGSTALLYPGTPRCMVFTVKNNLSVPISVQNISTTVNSLPTGCPSSNFALPTFTGPLAVSGGGSATTPGLPISLVDAGSNQDACQGATLSFVYSGNAQFTDSTSTALASSPNPAAAQPTTLSATVAGNNKSSDPLLPTGMVTFDSCPTAACSSTTILGTGSLGTGGVATFTTSTLAQGVHYLKAVYGGQGSDYSGSTSPVLTLTVGAPVTSAAASGSATTGSGSGSRSGVSTSPSSVAFTGADIAAMATLGVLMIGAGTFLVVVVRRRRRTARSES